MPIIPDFPRGLLEEHRTWHRARMAIDPANPPPGYGADFLEFHRSFIRRALDWYRRRGLDERLVAPWIVPPEPIRQSPCYDRAAEARILRMPRSFATADELGRFIEASGLHNCIHQQAALLYGEPELNDFDVAPMSTVFYQIHGMIDNWYRAWEEAAGGPALTIAAGGRARTGAAGRGRRGRVRCARERCARPAKRRQRPAGHARGRGRYTRRRRPSGGSAGGQARSGGDRFRSRRNTSR